MKKRGKRKSVCIEAEIILCEKMFTGVIVNLSENSALVEVPDLHKDFVCPPESSLELRFDDLSSGPISLSCRVKRIYAQKITDGTTTRVGLKIDHIPSTYAEFLKTLK